MELSGKLDKRARDQITHWRQELINLSRTSRLVYFKHTRSASLELVSPTPVVVLNALGRSGRANSLQFFYPPDDGEPLRVPSSQDLAERDKDAKQLRAGLQQLDRRA